MGNLLFSWRILYSLFDLCYNHGVLLIMKLYDLHRGDMFTLDELPKQPPDIPYDADTLKVYKLHNIDGMYSYVTDTYGGVFHFAAWTEVTKYDMS